MIVYEHIPSLLLEYSISAAKQDSLRIPRLVLNTCGFQDTDISEIYEKKRYCLRIFTENKNRLYFLRKIFAQLKLPGINLRQKSLKSNQWLTRWKKQWKPLSLTNQIDVVPFWYKDRYRTTKSVIYLDTLMSFGTGLHETTQLISRLIEDQKGRLGSFLDIGTGTGILTLLALKHGAKSAVAMDISPLSIEAAKSNLKVNGIKANVLLSNISSLTVKKKYHSVAANLITEDLLKYKKKIIDLVIPGGLLFVSGISLDNLSRFKKGFKDNSLICQTVSQGQQWAAIRYIKKML